MKTCVLSACVLAMILAASSAPAASPVTSGSRDSLFVSGGIEGWSLGVDAASTRRNVNVENIPASFKGSSYGGFIGWRGVSWLTLYTILGHADGEVGADNLDSGFAWALGLQANLWHLDMKDPEFLSGRWTLRAGAEYSAADVEGGDWQDITAALHLHYEIFTESVQATDRSPYSLALYAGPMVSYFDGTIDIHRVKEDFEADKEWGLAAGMELSISHNVLLGVGIEYFDETSWVGTLRYKF